MEAFLLSFGIVLIAELGDRSQLMSLAFATRYGAITVLLAATVATLLAIAGSVAIGSALEVALPSGALQVIVGLPFFGFALWTLRSDRPGVATSERARWSHARTLLAVGSAFFVAELGDTSMLAAVVLATSQEPLGTWLGSTAGVVAADAIGIAIGAFLGTRLPQRAIRVFGATTFAIVGAVLVAEGFGLL